MPTYFASFSLAYDQSYQTRYDNLMEKLRGLSPATWWSETTSFIIFATEIGMDDVVRHVKQVINVRTDTVVLGQTDYKVMRVIGINGDQDIYKLVPFAKPA